ncbi:MAG: hypothetical protein EXQ58_00545 [Acidobacteria bacterium]|nr:hypothetical protein [Acidobacteriota bacterium]
MNRRHFLKTSTTGLLLAAADCSATLNAGVRQVPSGKKLRTICNNDIDNILWALPGEDTTAEQYRHVVDCMLDARPGVLAQNVGLPDPVIYRSKVATSFDKYLVEVTKRVPSWQSYIEFATTGAARQAAVMRKLLRLGTDPLALTIEVCRKRGVPLVASYRMNSEDWYGLTWELCDFGRAHPEWRIRDTGQLDPAIPQVYENRIAIVREVADAYDIDGIELDFMRWTHMISEPQKNYAILTRMVADTRKLLDEAARKKGKKHLLLGVRVAHSLRAQPTQHPDYNCKELGLDVKSWIDLGLVDYMCPSYFGPTLGDIPRTEEFVALAKRTNVGIYPTVSSHPRWAETTETSPAAQRRLCDEICYEALGHYSKGADGISTYNWWPHHQPRMVSIPFKADKFNNSTEFNRVLMQVHPQLASPKKLQRCLKTENWQGI